MDIYGEIGVDGTGEPWEHTDSYSYRLPNQSASGTFDEAQWFIAGPDALETGDDIEKLDALLHAVGRILWIETAFNAQQDRSCLPAGRFFVCVLPSVYQPRSQIRSMRFQSPRSLDSSVVRKNSSDDRRHMKLQNFTAFQRPVSRAHGI